MISLSCFNRHFTPSWPMTVLAVLGMILFIRLGFWQLNRADEKKFILSTQAELAKQSPTLWLPEQGLPQQYQQIQIKGSYLREVFLLDNQHYQHRFGYHVLSPLITPENQIILIDRGWIAGDIKRQIFPQVEIPKDPQVLSGYAYFPSEKNWTLGPKFEQKKNEITIIELIDTNLISKLLHKSVYPFIMRLGKNADHGFVREWALVAMPPERHYAYALQWFGIALVILILFISLNMQKINHD